MSWPLPQDYLEAVQTPRGSFTNRELCQGVAETTALGLPRCASGRFASVFCFQCQDRKVAVRCFLEQVPDLHQRYAAISKFILADDMPCTVPFEYLDEGIQVNGKWYPILKMEWVEGPTFGEFIRTHFENKIAIGLLANYFKELTLDLHRHGIAHGDLQHDNIIVSDEGLRLVDYDGMFVPELAGRASQELGHENYQHPKRGERDFGPYLDNFSALVIYTSLRALSGEPQLWNELNANGDCLLLRRADFSDPDRSRAFMRLKQHCDKRVRQHAHVLRSCLNKGLEELPSLDSTIAAAETPQFQGGGSAGRTDQLTNVPDWLSDSVYMPYGSLAHIESTTSLPEERNEEASDKDGEECPHVGHSLSAVYPSPLTAGLAHRAVTIHCFVKLTDERVEHLIADLLLPQEQMLLAIQLIDTDPSSIDKMVKLAAGKVLFMLFLAFSICAIFNWGLAMAIMIPLLLTLLMLPLLIIFSTDFDNKLKPILLLTDRRILLKASTPPNEQQRWGAIPMHEIDTITLDRRNHQLQVRFRNAATLVISSDLSMLEEIADTLSQASPAVHPVKL